MEYLTFRRAIDRAWPTFDDPLPMPDSYDSGIIVQMREVYRELERRGTKVERFRLEKATRSVRCAATRRTSASCRSARTGASCTPTATSRT